MNTPKLASSEIENARSYFTRCDAVIDRDFDAQFNDMMNFGLHDEHDVRSIMDLPPHSIEVIYG